MWLRTLGPFAGLGLVVLIFALLTGSPEKYLSISNLRIVLSQTMIVALGAIGMTLIIISGGIDLSVGSNIALTSVVTALALRHSWPPSVALLGGIVVGGLVGLVNGLAITSLHRHSGDARDCARSGQVGGRGTDGERASHLGQRACRYVP